MELFYFSHHHKERKSFGNYVTMANFFFDSYIFTKFVEIRTFCTENENFVT